MSRHVEMQSVSSQGASLMTALECGQAPGREEVIPSIRNTGTADPVASPNSYPQGLQSNPRGDLQAHGDMPEANEDRHRDQCNGYDRWPVAVVSGHLAATGNLW
jgi:hypothetical protein